MNVLDAKSSFWSNTSVAKAIVTFESVAIFVCEEDGVAKKAGERLEGDRQLASWNLESQVMEAQAQLDRQQSLLENQFAGGQIDDLIADAMRRFGVAQTLQGLVGG